MHRYSYLLCSDKNSTTKDFLRSNLENARFSLVRKTITVTPEELDWSHGPGWNSIGMLLAHVISRENVTRIKYIERRELSQKEEKLYGPAAQDELQKNKSLLRGKNLQAYHGELQESRLKLLKGIEALSTKDFEEAFSDKEWNIVMNLFWVLQHIADDELNHRGQIILIRRLYKEYQTRSR